MEGGLDAYLCTIKKEPVDKCRTDGFSSAVKTDPTETVLVAFDHQDDIALTEITGCQLPKAESADVTRGVAYPRKIPFTAKGIHLLTKLVRITVEGSDKSRGSDQSGVEAFSDPLNLQDEIQDGNHNKDDKEHSNNGSEEELDGNSNGTEELDGSENGNDELDLSDNGNEEEYEEAYNDSDGEYYYKDTSVLPCAECQEKQAIESRNQDTVPEFQLPDKSLNTGTQIEVRKLTVQERIKNMMHLIELRKRQRQGGAKIINKDQTQETTERQPRRCTCPTCGKDMLTSTYLGQHMEQHGAKLFACDQCKKHFSSRRYLRVHKNLHREDGGFTCQHCGKKLATKFSHHKHVTRLHSDKGTNPEEKFPCPLCRKLYTTKGGVKVHMLTHTGARDFPCSHCGKAFRTKGAMVYHYRAVHANEKPHECDVCRRGFLHRAQLRRHYRTHTGEKPFLCNVCGKAFGESTLLNGHMISHSDEYPFKCNRCDKVYRSQSALRNHRDGHLGIVRHLCQYCGRQFQNYSNMLKHIRRHTGDHRHKCNTCSKTFVTKQELRQHSVKHDRLPAGDSSFSDDASMRGSEDEFAD